MLFKELGNCATKTVLQVVVAPELGKSSRADPGTVQVQTMNKQSKPAVRDGNNVADAYGKA